MTIEMTDAKMGRSMQKWEMFIAPARSVRHSVVRRLPRNMLHVAGPLAGGGTGSGRRIGDFQRRVGHDPDRTVDDDPFSGLKPIGNEPVVAMPRADLDHALMGLRVLVDHPQKMAFRTL